MLCEPVRELFGAVAYLAFEFVIDPFWDWYIGLDYEAELRRIKADFYKETEGL